MLDDILLLSLSKTLLHFVWQGAGLAASLYIALKLVNSQYSRLRYLLSLSTLGLIVIAPIATFLNLYDGASTPSNAFVIASQQSVVSASLVANGSFDWNSLLPAVAVGWLLGVCWFSAQLIYEVHKVKQLPRRGTSPVDEHIQALFDQLIVQLKANSLTRLMMSTKAEVPMVIGWLRPVVLVPASMITGLTPAQLEMLLAHELAHVKRHDYLINFFQNLVEVLFFFHPCVKWISNQVRVEREYCCDDIAVDCCGNPMAYARALTNAEIIRRDNIPQLAMAATGGDLKQRVLRLVGHSDCSAKPLGNWVSNLFAGITGISLVLFFVSAPHLATAESAQAPEVSTSTPLIDEIEEALPLSNSDDSSIQTILSVDSTDMDKTTLREETQDIAPPQPEAKEAISSEQMNKQVEVIQEEVATLISEARDNSVDDVELSQSDLIYVGVISAADINEPADTPVVDNVSSLNQPLKTELEQVQVAYQADIIEPKLLSYLAPSYPRVAQRKKLEAEFSVTFNVNEKGRVVDIEFNDDIQGFFKRSIKFALKRWRFEPGTIDGEVNSMQMTRVFSFANPTDKLMYVTGSRLPRGS